MISFSPPTTVCPGIALLLAHCLAARPLPPAYGLGDGAKPPENRQHLPVAALHQLWQDGAGMNESEKQFSFTCAASSTSGRAKNQIPISSDLALDPTHQLVNLKYVFRDPFTKFSTAWPTSIAAARLRQPSACFRALQLAGRGSGSRIRHRPALAAHQRRT